MDLEQAIKKLEEAIKALEDEAFYAAEEAYKEQGTEADRAYIRGIEYAIRILKRLK